MIGQGNLAPESIKEPIEKAKKAHLLFVESIFLNSFRNYDSARIEVSSAPVVLTGHNGAGKTNMLEAISLLMPGRGLRRAKLSEIDKQSNGQPWAVAANIHGMQGEVMIGTGRDPDLAQQADKRIIKIDGQIIRSQGELSRHMVLLWLTPQMEQLFLEGASSGRKFLDRLVYGFDAEHAARINRYEKAMRERNRLLQQNGDAVWLDAVEQKMIEEAAAIAQARLYAINHINHVIMGSKLSFPKAEISVLGAIEQMFEQGKSALEAEDSFRSILMENRYQDSQTGRTSAGIHRSELKVTHCERKMPAQQCSTGEQKAILLTIILAQARASAIWKGIIPVILLDEVIAHLDSTRKLELFEEICQIGAQTWMSGVDANLFADLQGKSQRFQVEDGRIIKQL